VIPFLTYLCTIGLSIPTVIAQVDLNFNLAVPFSSLIISWYALTLGLNVMITCMIAGRLLWARRNLRNVLGPEHARIYTSVSAMLIESGVIYAISNLILLMNTIFVNAFLNTWYSIHPMIIIISPFLIIARVAKGNAYSTDVTKTLPTVKFRHEVTGSTGPVSELSQDLGRSAATTIAVRFGKSRSPSFADVPSEKDELKTGDDAA